MEGFVEYNELDRCTRIVTLPDVMRLSLTVLILLLQTRREPDCTCPGGLGRDCCPLYDMKSPVPASTLLGMCKYVPYKVALWVD